MLSRLQLLRTARLVLNVEEGMTDEDDAEFLEWLLDQLRVCRIDLDHVLRGNWNSEDIDRLILDVP